MPWGGRFDPMRTQEMRRAFVWLLLAGCLFLAACGRQPLPAAPSEPVPEPEAPAPKQADAQTITEEETLMLHMKIGETAVAVDWEENASVAALLELCRETQLTISMSPYGGFEQVGAIGTSLPRRDVQITTEAGDIVLYAGNQLVVFYGSNSWAYTRLGHIADQSAAELAALLGNGAVTVTLSTEGAE